MYVCPAYEIENLLLIGRLFYFNFLKEKREND